MKELSDRLNRTLGIGAAACVLGMLACSSSEAPPPGGPGGAGGQNTTGCQNQNLQIYFSPMYSAFDNGAHTYQIPAIVSGVSNATVTWTAEPSDAVALDARPELLMITTRKAGAVTIKAQNGNNCGSAPLTISDATAALWEAGNARYNNSQPLPPIPNPPVPPMDGSNLFEVNGARPACTNCHGDTATTGIFKGITHTPQQTGGFTDDELIQVIRAGVIPEGGYYNDAVGIPQRIWQFFHRWTISDDEARGLVVYLRSLTPKSAGGSVDFSGIGRGGSSGMGGRGGSSGTGGAGGTGGTGGTGGAGGAVDGGGSGGMDAGGSD
jgi:hypothetical protein